MADPAFFDWIPLGSLADPAWIPRGSRLFWELVLRLEDALFSARATRQQFCPWEFRAPAPEGESPTEEEGGEKRSLLLPN